MWTYLVVRLILLAVSSAQNVNLAEPALPCDFYQSVNITDGFKHGNGSISYNGQMFPSGSYGYTDKIVLYDRMEEEVEEHIRGCICGLENSKPCVPFCCPENYLKFKSSVFCEKYNHKLIVNSTNDELYSEVDVIKDYTPILQKCFSYNYNLRADEGHSWKLLKVSKF